MKIEDIIEFKSLSNPIGVIWNVGSYKVFGVLTWESKTPLLKLTLEGEGAPENNGDPKHPVFTETSPPLQPTISGSYPGYGRITLYNCCQIDWNNSVSLREETFVCILTLQPTQIWLGTPREEFTEGFSAMTLTDSRLAGFFGSPGLRQHFLQSNQNQELFDALDKPSCVWTFHKGGLPSFALDETNLTLTVGGLVRSGSSAKTGYSAQSSTEIIVSADQSSSLENLDKIRDNLEQIISIFSLESFSFECVEYSFFTKSTSLIWYIGEDCDRFLPPMRHQVLVDFCADGVFEKICNSWLQPSEETALSRWLFCKSLRESDDGLARFVTVAQALEVLERDKGPPQTMKKCEFRRALKSIWEAIGDFDKSFVDRVIGLVSSSNKSSFRHMLEYMIGQSASSLGDPFSKEDVEEFSKLISNTRNALVHMTTTHKSKLNEAFSVVNKLRGIIRLTYQTQDVDMTDDRPAIDDALEVEVTPEMIEAGEYFLEEYFGADIIDRSISTSHLLAQIFRAMHSRQISF